MAARPNMSPFLALARRPVFRVLVPLAVVVLAGLTQLAFAMIDVPARYFLFCGAVIVAAFVGEWVGGILATALSLVLILARGYFHKRFPVSAEANFLAHATFVGLCIAETWLVNALLRAKRSAESLARVRSELLMMASHDVRSPLAAIRMQVEVIRAAHKRRGSTSDPARQEARLLAVETQIARIDELLRDLLDASRLDTGHVSVKLSYGDLCQSVRGVIERHADALARAGCRLDVDLPPTLWGQWDQLRCEQVVTNLLTNAMKYGAGHPVHVSAYAEEDHACIKVRDEGVGIAPEHHEAIFRRFERVGDTQAFRGHGLGLWIVRRIVEAMGGRITVKSQLGQGATFIVSLPTHGPAQTRQRQTGMHRNRRTDDRPVV